MKSFSFLLFVSIIFQACNSRTEADPQKSLSYFKEIDSLFKRDAYFDARDRYLETQNDLTEFHRLRAGASIDNVFNRLAASNLKIDTLLSNFRKQLSEQDLHDLFQLKQMNHSKLFEYGRADSTLHVMLTSLRQIMKADEIKDNENSKKIWAALKDQPQQEVLVKGESVLQIKRDRLGLQNLVLTVGSDSLDVIFDTGANLSTVTETTAKRLNIRVMDGTTIDVGSITGQEVKSQLGVCPEFRLGNITVKNAVFLVFPDQALTIPQAKFQINCILGFPVIEAMKEVQLTKSGQFIVPAAPSKHTEQNMALKYLTPVIYLNAENFTFDTGANTTTLYDTYFKKHRDSIESKYQAMDISLGGAGGHITQKGYQVRFETKINDKPVVLDSVQLLTEKLKDENYFAGNIGQDLIGKFEKMTINFEDMFIRFD
jgi:Predicted aspartyl protease